MAQTASTPSPVAADGLYALPPAPTEDEPLICEPDAICDLAALDRTLAEGLSGQSDPREIRAFAVRTLVEVLRHGNEVLKAALVVYLSPLGGLLAGAILASQSGLTDGWIALAAAAGLGAGLLAARVLALSSHLVSATAPRVLGPLPARAMPAGSCNVAG